jgi:hypothetical protein
LAPVLTRWSRPNPRRSTTLDDRRSLPPEPKPKPPGLRAQLRSTRDAALGLALAHVELAKAEAAAIGAEIAKVAAYVGIAIAVVLLAIILLVVGSSLFFGEWLLGSMGWGVLHGVLLLIAIAVGCSLATVGVSGTRLGRSVLAGIAVGVLIALILVFALPNRLYASIGEAVLPAVEPGVRPLVVGVAIWTIIGLVGGLIVALRLDEWGGRIGALLGGAAIGVIIGAVTAVDTGPQVGVGIGIAVGYLTLIGLMIADISRTGVDVEALQARFIPTRTIETSKETLEWLQSKMPPGIGS